MSSNKKSSLTGYLPDILMAAAAVRPFPRMRRVLPTSALLCPSLSCKAPSDTSVASDSLLRHSQPPHTPRP